jgi:hypothetical protein
VKHWFVIALFVPLVLAAGCKQGLGDRCEVNGDCASGTCSQAVPRICVASETDHTMVDADLPIDAAIDAPAVAE